jgi:hypothetical protein
MWNLATGAARSSMNRQTGNEKAEDAACSCWGTMPLDVETRAASYLELAESGYRLSRSFR